MKILKITGIVLAVLLAIMIILPFAFKGKVSGIIQKQADKYLNAKMTFDGLSLNLFSNFPNITASLNDFMIVGTDSFAHDTLVYSKSARLAINLKSLMTDNGFRIKKVELKDAKVYIKWLATGEANWRIMKPDTLPVEPSADTSAMHFELDRVELTNARVIYDDRKHDMLADLKGWNGSLNGDLSSGITTISTESVIESLNFTLWGMPILKDVKMDFQLTFDADLDKYVFNFKSNKILLNAVELGFGGRISMPGDNIDFDLKANTSKVTFKQFLSLVPAFYTKDFSSMKTAGDLKLDFFMKGLMTDLDWPAFGFKLLVENAMFQYPSLPKSVQDIQIACNITNPGGTMDKTLVDLSKFHFNMAGNIFDLSAHVATPQSDPDVKGTMASAFNLGMIKDVYPLEKGTKLLGNIQANMAVAGKMSWLDKKQYDKFMLNGALAVSGIQYQTKGLPDVNVKSAKMDFTPQSVHLTNLSVLLGKNDIQASGTLSNMLGWFLRDDVLSGSLQVHSTYLNLNDFMTEGATTTSTDTAPMQAFEIPQNLDLSLKATGKKIFFNSLMMTNSNAALTVKNGRVSINNLSANALGGSIGVKGYYEALNPEKPNVAFGLDLKTVSFAQTFTSFDFVKKIAPIFENVNGSYSLKMDFNTSLDKHLNPDLKVLNGSGLLQSNGVFVSNMKVLDVLATTLKNEKLRTIAPKDLNIPFKISDGKVTTSPFTIQVDGIALELGGITGLDKTIDYKLGVTLPENRAVVGVTKFQGTIKGTFSKPVIRLDLAEVAQKAAVKLADKALKATLETNTEEAKAKIDAEVDRKADALRAQAKAAGDKLIAEAATQGDNLIAKANNPLVKVAAKATAAQLKKEAEKEAANLLTEAEARIKRTTTEAQAKVK